MIVEYPNYYPDFHCIAGACTETCCAGWEVDLDEDALTYYQNIAPAPFGDVIRAHIGTNKDGDYVFPLNKDGRCPFLNQDNLCDIILHLGESRICQTCTEHPRFVVSVADYRQYDLSLSCPEACRLFFREDHPFSVIRKERPTPSYLTESYLEDKEFTHYLEMRNLALSLLSEQDVPMPKRLTQVSESVLGGASLEKDPRAALLQKLKPEDPWDTRWGEALKQLQETLPMMTPEREAIFLMRNEAELEPNFEKLSEYLAFRYFPDAYYLGNPVYAVNMLRRSIHLLYLFAFSYWWRGEQSSASDYRLTTEDFMQFCHLFSREVEHDDENIAALRGA